MLWFVTGALSVYVLTSKPRLGKAAYLCAEGLIVVNLAPHPPGFPGLGK